MDYDDYRKLYMKQHRATIPNRGSQGFMRWAAILLFISSAAVSGAHTIPTIYQTLKFDADLRFLQIGIAIISLFMVEIALFAIAFSRRMQLVDRRWLLGLMQFIALAVAIAGNLYSTFKALGIIDDLGSANGFTVFLGIAIGLGAPLFTMLSGDLLAGVELKYQEAWKKFEGEILRTFKQQEKATERASARMSDSVRSVSDNRRRTDASEVVRSHLEEHPEDRELSVRTLAEKLNVGRTTAHNVLSEFHSNGHS